MKEEEQASSFIPVVKSSSENKVYEIGNRYKPSSEEMVVLTGKVTDFKSGQNLEGINIVHREPWVATATDRQGNFTIKLPVGYNTIEINGLNIKETRRQFMVYGEGATHIELEEENHLLDEVLIVSGRVQNVRSTQLGMEKFQPSLLKNIPTAMGEVDLLKMLQTLPGIKEESAANIIAEIGVDMKMFLTASAIVGWAGLKPRNDQSAGKIKSRKITHGNKYLRKILVEAAWSAARTKDSRFMKMYQRLLARGKSKQKALIAVARKLLVLIWNMLSKKEAFNPEYKRRIQAA